MLGRHKLLLLIPAILLIGILLGMPPLIIAHKLASGGPFTQCKQGQWSIRYLFHFVTSRNDPTIVNVNITPLDQGSTPTFDIQVLHPNTIHSNITIHSLPLRC